MRTVIQLSNANFLGDSKDSEDSVIEAQGKISSNIVIILELKVNFIVLEVRSTIISTMF